MASFMEYVLVSVGVVVLVIGIAVGYAVGKCCGSPRKSANIPKDKKSVDECAGGAESIASFIGLTEVPQESGVWVACAKGSAIHADVACPAIKHLRVHELVQYKVCSKCTGKGRVRILKSIWHPYLCSGSRPSKEE